MHRIFNITNSQRSCRHTTNRRWRINAIYISKEIYEAPRMISVTQPYGRPRKKGWNLNKCYFLTQTSVIPSWFKEAIIKTFKKPGQPTVFSVLLSIIFFSFKKLFGFRIQLGSNVFCVNVLVISNSIRFDLSISILFKIRKLGTVEYSFNVSSTVECSSFRVQEFETSWITQIKSACCIEWRQELVNSLVRWCFLICCSVTRPGVSNRIIWALFRIPMAFANVRVVWTFDDVGQIW